MTPPLSKGAPMSARLRTTHIRRPGVSPTHRAGLHLVTVIPYRSRGYTIPDNQPDNVRGDRWKPLFWVGAFVFSVGVLYLFAACVLKPLFELAIWLWS